MPHMLYPIYSIGQSVGKNAVNETYDLRLIQLLLQDFIEPNIGEATAYASNVLKTTLPSVKTLNCNGLYSTDLQTWIDFYLKWRQSKGANVSLDGKFDPLDYDKYGSLLPKTRRNLYQLCVDAAYADATRYVSIAKLLSLKY
jgi:hypothetical protein